jgi:hypothetical protein
MFLLPIDGNTQSTEHETIKDLSEDWLYYHENEDEYLPLIQDMDKVAAVHFHLPLPEYQDYHLYLQLVPESSIWINQKLIRIASSSIITWPIDSLINLYGSKNIFISIYKPASRKQNLASYIIYEKGIEATLSADIVNFELRKTQNTYRDFFILGLIIILIIYTILLNVHARSFKTFYDISHTLSLNIREEYTFKGRAFNTTNIAIILGHCFLIAYLVMVIIGFQESNQPLDFKSLNGAIWQWIIFSAIAFLIFLVKYWIINLIGGLFDLREIINRHYLEYLRMSKIFFAFLFVVLCIIYLGFEVDIGKNHQIFINFAIAFLIIRVLLLFFKFMRSSSFKNFYLFAYLCSTEFLPLIIGLKFILDI